MKKILVVFHEFFLKNNMGCNAYILNMMKYLKYNNFQIDFFYIDINNNEVFDFNYYNKKENNIITNFFYYKIDHVKKKKEDYDKKLFNIIPIIKKTENVKYIIYKFFGIFRITIKKKNKYKYSDLSFIQNDSLVDEFNRIVLDNKYNFISTNHLGVSFLVSNLINKDQVICIHTMHDLAFIQRFYKRGIKYIERIFINEIIDLNIFDKIFCVSSDEALFIRRFFNKKIEFIPYLINEINLTNTEKTIDLLFLGSDNIYNCEAIIWFLENVYKQLNQNINITICGSVIKTDNVKKYIESLSNLKINTIEFIENLDDLYSKTKIAVIPMLRGTGIKIKTLDAMSRGIPIVSSILGVDGLEDKRESGCIIAENSDEFIYYINKLLEDIDFYNQTKEKINYYFNKYLSAKITAEKIKNIFEI